MERLEFLMDHPVFRHGAFCFRHGAFGHPTWKKSDLSMGLGLMESVGGGVRDDTYRTEKGTCQTGK